MPMPSTDREEFTAQMRKLMGGFDVFPNPDKIDAYWLAFSTKISLAQFSRIIDHALTEEGPKDMPTVPEMWGLYRQLRTPKPAQAAKPEDKPIDPATLLCAYAVGKLDLSPGERAAPWEYRYREWWTEGKRQSELNAVHIPRANGHVTRITVAEMHADTAGHALALKSFEPGPKPLPPSYGKAVLQTLPLATPAPDFSDAPSW